MCTCVYAWKRMEYEKSFFLLMYKDALRCKAAMCIPCTNPVFFLRLSLFFSFWWLLPSSCSFSSLCINYNSCWFFFLNVCFKFLHGHALYYFRCVYFFFRTIFWTLSARTHMNVRFFKYVPLFWQRQFTILLLNWLTIKSSTNTFIYASCTCELENKQRTP